MVLTGSAATRRHIKILQRVEHGLCAVADAQFGEVESVQAPSGIGLEAGLAKFFILEISLCPATIRIDNI
jgi:hypothetical protein